MYEEAEFKNTLRTFLSLISQIINSDMLPVLLDSSTHCRFFPFSVCELVTPGEFPFVVLYFLLFTLNSSQTTVHIFRLFWVLC